MKKPAFLPIYQELMKVLERENMFIQVLVGPRQVGKTTGVQLLFEHTRLAHRYHVSI